MNLFDLLDPPKRESNWVPVDPPCLDGITDIQINFETNGLKWWDGHKPIAASLCLPDERTFYLPWGHRGGGNLDEAVVKRWFEEQVKCKRITNTNTRFDVHMARVWGIDLEAQGNQVADVSHYAALLDDHRQRFALDILINDFFGHPPEVPRLDESHMDIYHAGEAAPRSMFNVLAVKRLKDIMWPELENQNLHKVRLLEQELIYVVCEMEKNGAKINVEKLDRWIREAEQMLQQWTMEIYNATSIKFNFGSNNDFVALFNKLGIEFGGRTAKGAPSFTDDILKRVEHPIVKLARKGNRVKSLLSKYLYKYRKNVDSNGIIRYALHQLRTAKDDTDVDSDSAGVGFGRFSSTEILSRPEKVGLNIQQTIKVKKQLDSLGEDFIIRELHIPESGIYLSADAQQIEYRLFAHEANAPSVIAAYKENPEMSFHNYMWERVKVHQPEMTYRRQKDTNFAKIYGAGIKKLAFMLEFITRDEYARLVQEQAPYDHPLLVKAVEVDRIYNQVLPEVKPLNDRAMNIARTRGFIKTILGRRGRFPDQIDVHKALNRRIQGSAADIMKVKLVELHKARKQTGFLLRYPVHDSVDGDAPDQECVEKVKAILNRQSFPSLRIPILWAVKTGANWRECGDD